MATRKSNNTSNDTIIDIEPVEMTTEEKLAKARAEHKAAKAAKKAAKVEAVAPETANPWIGPLAKTLGAVAVAAGIAWIATPLVATAAAAAVAFTGWAFMSWVITIIGWLISLVAAHFSIKLAGMGYTRLSTWIAPKMVTA